MKLNVYLFSTLFLSLGTNGISQTTVDIINNDSTVVSGAVVNLASTVNLTPYTSNALEVSNYNSLGILDNDPTPLLRTVDVVAPGIDASQLYYITVNISQTWNGDLDIILIAPDGSQIELSTDNGGSGDGYYGCHFTNDPSHPNITTVPVISVITGNFAPEQPFTALTGPMTGTWTLSIVDDASGDYGNFENFTLGYPEANSIVSYSWSPTTGLSDATIANPVATIASTTTYTLTVEDATGATTTDNVTFSIASAAGVFENTTTSFSVYPNPASNNITIKNLAHADALILVDISGKVIFSTSLSSSTLEMDVTQFETGIYFIQVLKDSQIIATEKLIINH